MIASCRSVTQMESKLGVSDNMLPGGKRSVDKGQFALSSYDQEILAKGPPQQGSGPPPDQPTQPAAPSPSYSPMGSYSQGSYQSPYAAYPNTYGSGTAASTQSPGYSYYQPQQYSPYQASPYQASYQSQPVYQQQYSQVCSYFPDLHVKFTRLSPPAVSSAVCIPNRQLLLRLLSSPRAARGSQQHE